MIVFDGSVSGEAEKRVLEKTRDYEQTVFLVLGLLWLPVWAFVSYKTGFWPIVVAHVVAFATVPIFARIPKSKKEKLALCPNNITIDGEYIFVTTGKKEYRLNVKDVKEVQDCKTYYELRFPLRKICNSGICQKDLLVKGTLQEFETLFAGKITDLSNDFD